MQRVVRIPAHDNRTLHPTDRTKNSRCKSQHRCCGSPSHRKIQLCMKRFFKSHVALLVWRLALLYAVLAVCRLLFWRYNFATIGALSAQELPALIAGAWKFDTVSILYANAVLVLLSLVPLHLRERRWWQRMLYFYYVIVNALLVVAVNLADAVYFRYTQKRFTAEEIFFAENDNSLQLVGKFLGENIPLLLAGIALIALLAWAGGRKARPEPLCRSAIGYYGGGAALLVVAALLAIAGMRGGMTRMTRPITLSNATLYASDNDRANLILSNPFCILRTVGQGGGVEYQRYYTPEELESIYSPLHRPDSVGKAPLAGRNIVLFVMESMSAEHSAHLSPDLYANLPDKGFTPFLDSLMQQGYCFTRMYANGSRSIQALPAVLGSIPSFKTPFVLMPQALAPTRQLPRILRDKGYETAFFCGSSAGSMGFGAYARSAGIEHLYSREEYEEKHGTKDFDGYWGIWDGPFLQFLGEELSGGGLQEPFFASLFTLSSHHPFVVPDAWRDRLPDGLTRNHKCVAYTDKAFRAFFDRFHEEAWFRRTVFVFVADHVSSEKFAEVTRTFPGNHHIIGFLYTPDGSLRGECRAAVSQIDLMPTLLGLTGCDDEPYFAFGRDLFREPAPDGGSFALCYDNGFEAATDNRVLFFDERRVTGIYDIADIQRSRPLAPTAGTEALERQIRAFIQQYYSHIEHKAFTVE